MKSKFIWLLLFLCFSSVRGAFAAPAWEARLDGRVQFYQTTDFGVLLAATERSLYAIDGGSGETLWRRNNNDLRETQLAPIPGTDLILLSLDAGDRSRVAALDVLTGSEIWVSDKIKGEVLQLAVEPDKNLLCAVLIKNPRGNAGQTLKREPQIAVFDLQTGELLWKRELGGEIEMMPARFNDSGETNFTLDNYRAPLILDERVFLFYEGATSFDARTGRERERERFDVNVDGLALTEADPTFDDQFVYTSGRGKVRAVRRSDGGTEWEASDLGVTPEMFAVGERLYVRTGGQFTRIKDGEIVSRGAYGVSAIDRKTGKTVWRYKGADKGLTNFVFADANTILLADRNELIAIDARDGKRRSRVEHDVEDAQFVLINENNQTVVGGREELAAFDSVQSSRFNVQSQINAAAFSKGQRTKGKGQTALWRVKYEPPGRSVLSRVGSIALRATALYFRYGGLVNAGFNIFRGASIARSALGLRWSGVRSRIGNFDLTSLATNAARNYAVNQIRTYGIAARANLSNVSRFPNSITVPTRPNLPSLPSAGNVAGTIARNNLPTREGVQESLLDRLDPANVANRLADYLSRRQRLAALRGTFMYFYTELERGGKGLVGVNVTNGNPQRQIRLNDPDPRFVTDETVGLLYSASNNRLTAFSLNGN